MAGEPLKIQQFMLSKSIQHHYTSFLYIISRRHWLNIYIWHICLIYRAN